MDRLEQLGQNLLEQLDQRRTSAGPECSSTAQLEAYLAGSLVEEERTRVESHLERCNSCLRALLVLRDLQGVRWRLWDPTLEEHPELKWRFLEVIEESERRKPSASLGQRIWTTVRDLFQRPVPVGWALGEKTVIVVPSPSLAERVWSISEPSSKGPSR